MAKVVMPVFSHWAIGTLGKTVTYKRRRGVFVASKYQSIPKTWSDLQERNRILFKKACRLIVYYKKASMVIGFDTLSPSWWHIT